MSNICNESGDRAVDCKCISCYKIVDDSNSELFLHEYLRKGQSKKPFDVNNYGEKDAYIN